MDTYFSNPPKLIQLPIGSVYGYKFQEAMQRMKLFTKTNACGISQPSTFLFYFVLLMDIGVILQYIYKASMQRTMAGKANWMLSVLMSMWISMYFLHAIKNCAITEGVVFTIIYTLIAYGIHYLIKYLVGYDRPKPAPKKK